MITSTANHRGHHITTLTFDHVGLSVADLDAQRRFYSQALGLAEETHTDIPQAQIRTAILGTPTGPRIELIERRGSAPQNFTDAYDGVGTQGYFHWALAVDDLDRAFDGILAAGATQVSAPADTMRPGVRFAYVKDPEGNLIELTQTANEAVNKTYNGRRPGRYPDKPQGRRAG